MSLVQKAKEFRKEFDASKKASQKFILLQDIPEEELKDLIYAFPSWENFQGKRVLENQVVRYEDQLWRAIQPHDWQADWTPSAAVSLYVKHTVTEDGGGTEVVAEWEQRYGHNPYVRGDKVLWTDGQVYQCVADTTTYSPKDVPAHWALVE